MRRIAWQWPLLVRQVRKFSLCRLSERGIRELLDDRVEPLPRQIVSPCGLVAYGHIEHRLGLALQGGGIRPFQEVEILLVMLHFCLRGLGSRGIGKLGNYGLERGIGLFVLFLGLELLRNWPRTIAGKAPSHNANATTAILDFMMMSQR